MFKKKYRSVLAEYEKFWERTNTSRPIMDLAYPIEGATPYRAPISLEEQWLDENYNLAAHKHNLGVKGYMAEGIPCLFPNLGPGCLAACIGGSYVLAPDTVWFDRKPIVDDWENPPEIKFNEQSEMWQHLTRLQSKYASDPDISFSITDLGGIMDIVASLRSTEMLLYDLYDYSDEVKSFTAKVTEIWLKAFDLQLEAIRKAGLPYNNWMNIPSEKPWFPIQCDFSAMISPKQFEEFVLPGLVQQVNHMDRSIYHLDGPGELPHVDILLDIPGLTGIQWTSGAGEKPLYDKKWFDLYKKIQDKKKNLVLLGGIHEGDMAGAERLIKSIDPTGVCMSVWASSRDKAEEIVEKVTRWSE
ncbi:MAG: hypothetical protein IKB34_02755 [Clostridia bacterium]|nr:hypothetical protein [Clostridia bacterium]